MNCAIDPSKTCTSTSGARGCSRPRREQAKALLVGRGEISAMRRAEEKRAIQRQLTSGIVYHVGTTGSKLVYPRDVPGLPRKKCKTWDHRAQGRESAFR